MMRRIADSIMAGLHFQTVAGFGISKSDGEEEERENNAKDVGHTGLLLLEVVLMRLLSAFSDCRRGSVCVSGAPMTWVPPPR